MYISVGGEGGSLDKTDGGLDCANDGADLGSSVGLRVVGTSEGVTVGAAVGGAVGTSEGWSVFKAAGLVGASVGNAVGAELGTPVEGDAVGARARPPGKEPSSGELAVIMRDQRAAAVPRRTTVSTSRVGLRVY